MYVDWPLTSFVGIGSLSATVACRLLVHTAKASCKAIRAAVMARRRREQPEPRANFPALARRSL